MLRDLLSVTFLLPNKKVTKEVGIGEVADREGYLTCILSSAYFPAFEPPSPMYPFWR